MCLWYWLKFYQISTESVKNNKFAIEYLVVKMSFYNKFLLIFTDYAIFYINKIIPLCKKSKQTVTEDPF